MAESRLPSHGLKSQEVSDDTVGELAVRKSVGRLQLEPEALDFLPAVKHREFRLQALEPDVF